MGLTDLEIFSERLWKSPRFVSSEDVVKKTLKNLNQSYKINLISNKADISNEAINILNVDGCHDYDLGSPKESNAKYILDCLKKASDLSKRDKSCLITGPVNKKVLNSYEKKFSGHTDFLKSRFDGSTSIGLGSGKAIFNPAKNIPA